MVTGTSAPPSPVLTPRGRLLLAQVDDAPALSSDLSHRLQDARPRGGVGACPWPHEKCHREMSPGPADASASISVMASWR